MMKLVEDISKALQRHSANLPTDSWDFAFILKYIIHLHAEQNMKIRG